MDQPSSAGLEARLAAISRQVAELQAQLSEATTREETQKHAFDQLYAELRQYKDDFVFQAEKPLLLDLLLFYDSLNWFQQSLVKKEMSPDVISDSFQYLLDEFLEVLYRRDVQPVEPSETYDRENHKAVKVVATDDPAQDQQVEQVLKRGFSRAGKLLRAEEIVLYRHDARGGDGGSNAGDR